MNEKIVIQFLRERTAGVSSYLKPLPDAPLYLAPDRPFTGRFVTLADGKPLQGPLPDERRHEVEWFGCTPTTASRIPARRTRRSFRVRANDLEDNREVVAEALIEHRFWLIQRAEDRRRKIWDQPPPRSYVLADGSVHQHTFDFLVEEFDGRRIAYAIRPEEDIDEDLTTALDCIRAQSLDGFADAAVLITDCHVTLARVRNAIEILDARENRNEADVQVAAGLVADIRGSVMLTQLVDALSLGPRGHTAVFCLVDDGVLEPARKERFGPTTLLRRVRQRHSEH